MTAASVALGMNLKVDVNRPHARSTRPPVITPPIGVLTPEALLTAVRVKLPVVGIDFTKLPNTLQSPSASISWLASRVFPLAANFVCFKFKSNANTRDSSTKFAYRTPWRWRCSREWRWGVSRGCCCQARQLPPQRYTCDCHSQYWTAVRRTVASPPLYRP